MLLPWWILALALFSSRFLPSSSADAVYDSLVRCLADRTKTPVENLSDAVFVPTNSSYTSALRAYIRNARFNTTGTPKPAVIIAPRDESLVSASVACAKSLNHRLRIRSGGHDYEGLSYVSSQDPFFVLDLSNKRNVSVELTGDGNGTAWIDAGATLGEVYYAIWKTSNLLGFPAGVCPTVGAGGHISGGGYGAMVRKHGLTVDHVVDAKIVNAKGEILDRMSMGEDLFWAILGGGGASFGVILGFKVSLVAVPETVTVFKIQKLQEEGAIDMVHRWQFVAPRTNPNLFMRVLLQPVTVNKRKTVRASVVALFLGKSAELVDLLRREFPELGLKKENCSEMSWIRSVLWWAHLDQNATATPETLLDREPDSAKFVKRKSDYVSTEIGNGGLSFIFKKLRELGKVGLVFNPYGGKMNETAVTATPFPHRRMLFKVQHSVTWSEAGPQAEQNFLGQIRSLYSYMAPFVTKNPRRAYLNYRDVDIGINHQGDRSYKEGEVYGRKFFAENFERLVKVKTAVDPENFFRYEQSIPTLPSKARRG